MVKLFLLTQTGSGKTNYHHGGGGHSGKRDRVGIRQVEGNGVYNIHYPLLSWGDSLSSLFTKMSLHSHYSIWLMKIPVG